MGSIKRKGQRRKLKGFVRVLLMVGFLLLAFGLQRVQAQTWDEWWNQKQTQIKYLTDQIAALQVYGKYVRQGYAVSRDGLGSVSGWAKGELGLHTDHYAGLKLVNQAVKDDPRVAEAVYDAQAIPGLFDGFDGLSGLSAGERQYVASVRTKVLKELDEAVAELQVVMTSGQVEMSDAERLKKLGEVYLRIRDQYVFAVSFCNSVRSLLEQRKAVDQDVITVRRLYGIN